MANNNSKVNPIISLKSVSKWYDNFQALKNIDLEIKLKEKIVICGPSGSGKSTLIRCLNRLEAHQEGQIHVDRKSTRLNSSHSQQSRMPSSA